MAEMNSLQEVISTWAEATFQHDERSIAAHLLAEATALYRSTGGTEEMAHDIVSMEYRPDKTLKSVKERSADVGILDLTMAGFMGYSLEEAIIAKMTTNMGREWSKEPNRLGFCEHVRSEGE